MIASEPRVETIDGHRVIVIERKPPLPPTLEGLRRAMRVTFEIPLRRFGGARAACTADQDHRLFRFLEGRHVGTDGITRALRLLICRDCEAVCVRDVSIDAMPGLNTGRLAPRRRDHIMAWYAGSRPGAREYR